MNEDYEEIGSEEEAEEIYGLEGYKQYIKFNILSTLFCSLVCIALVSAITFVINMSGNDKLAWLYLLPVVTYILS